MSIKLQIDFDASFNSSSLINSKEEANQSQVSYVQRKQTLVLKIISSLIAIRQFSSIALSSYILCQYLGKFDDEYGHSLSNLFFYPAFASACASIVWEFVSDRVGRKRVLNISLIGSALTMVLYGFSNATNSVGFVNVLLNIFGCSNIFINTVIGDSSCNISKPKAFNYFFIIDMVGKILSLMITTPFLVPIIYDMALEKDTISITGTPYMIPSLIAGSINVAAFILCYYCLRDTLTYRGSRLNGPAITDLPANQANIYAKSKKINIFGSNLSKNRIFSLIASSLLSLIYEVYFIICQTWLIIGSSKGGLNSKF